MAIKQCFFGLAASLGLLLGGCGGNDSTASADSATPEQAQGGYATGHVLTADGKPITAPGAELTISIYGVSTAGEKVSYSPAIKPDGTYRQKLVPGAYRFGVLSHADVQYNGQKVTLPLEPVGTMWNKDREAEEGIQQDFVLKLTGKKYLSEGDVNTFTDWYGATINPLHSTYRYVKREKTPEVPDGTKLTFTLTPTGPRIDGQPAEKVTVERTWHAGALTEMDALNDLPIADYTLTGSATLPDGTTKPLLFEPSSGKVVSSQPIRFKAQSVGGVGPVVVNWFFE